MIIIAKWLAQVVPTTFSTLAQGAYLVSCEDNKDCDAGTDGGGD